MLKDKNRTRIIISFSLAALFVVLTLNAFWGIITDNSGLKMGALPLVFTILTLAALSDLFRLAYTLTDKTKLEEYVKQKVTESNAKIIKEFQEKEKQEEADEELIDDTEDSAKEMLPSGNFKKIDTFGRKLLVNLANELNLAQGILFLSKKNSKVFEFCAGYALTENQKAEDFKLGESLTGEAAKDQKITTINEIPAEYFNVESGLGSSKPGCLTIVPIISNDKTIAVMELATFSDMTEKNLKILEKVAALGAAKIEQIVKS